MIDHMYQLKDDNPDKGTETGSTTVGATAGLVLKDDNPDKGTETIYSTIYRGLFHC